MTWDHSGELGYSVDVAVAFARDVAVQQPKHRPGELLAMTL